MVSSPRKVKFGIWMFFAVASALYDGDDIVFWLGAFKLCKVDVVVRSPE